MKYILFMFMLVGIESCTTESSYEKMQYDIANYKKVFHNNLNQFISIGEAIDSITNITHEPKTVERSFLNVPSRLYIQNLDKNKVNWKLEADSVDGKTSIYRIKIAIGNLKSHCTVFNYYYVENGEKSKSVLTTSQRNVTYERLHLNWLLEIDNSSPCID